MGKATVVGAKDRDTNRISAAVVSGTDRATLQGFVTERAADGATVYTDDHASYKGIPYPHKTVKHSVSEYVKDQAHTNGIESHWAMLKRGYHGGYHQMSAKSTCIAMSRRHGHWTRRIRWSLWLLELSASVCGTRNSPADLKVERIAQVIPLKCDAVTVLSRGYSFHGSNPAYRVGKPSGALIPRCDGEQ